ncbi:hypothetical protein ADP8_05233 (plasmid) [Roseomonas mucosa]|nr:hypothetical protein ADP8_05233 [Roseomonas mucosa]
MGLSGFSERRRGAGAGIPVLIRGCRRWLSAAGDKGHSCGLGRHGDGISPGQHDSYPSIRIDRFRDFWISG